MRTTEGTILAGADLAAFRAEKARIDRIRAAGGERRPQVQRAAAAPAAAAPAGLRPAQG